MADSVAGTVGGLSPVAVVWCRQVDNEAESPGYTTIPEDFAGRRETLEAIRLIGNLTVNVADTHDYWDPDPAQPLSYYPNLFLYPAANGRYTCVGRMFLSTEDRPRLGMKTLVFSTADLVASGEFGAAVLRAHATMGGQASPARPGVEPDPLIYQTVGEGFLFHRGTTEPVVIVASDQWEAAGQVVLELVRLLPTSLVALGAFLVFPYFLPEAKVNLHEFTEQVPLALGLMRVPRGEAQGDRHAKRIQSWESAPVALRDLTKPGTSRSKETLPLILQYVRDHQEEKVVEVGRRVDLVEGPRVHAHLDDAERQGGRDRRKEMWRIGTAMETAALLLARPKGRSVPTTGEVAKRANEYLQAQPSISLSRPTEPAPILAPVSASMPAGSAANQHPPWLQRPTDIQVPPPGPVAVPISVSDDPSVRAAPAPGPLPTTAPASPAAPPGGVAVPATSNAELEAWVKSLVDERVEQLGKPIASVPDPALIESKVVGLVDQKVRESTAQSAQAILGIKSDLGSRVAAVESRPVVDPAALLDQVDHRVAENLAEVHQQIQSKFDQVDGQIRAKFDQVDGQVQAKLDPALAQVGESVKQTLQSSSELWAERLREELRQNVEELKARSVRSEEELRAALVAQLDLELAETKDQGNSLREEVEGRVRDLIAERTVELDQKRLKEVRELETRFGILVDGRAKDLEKRLVAAIAEQREKVVALADQRIQQSENRVSTEREARIAEVTEASTAAVAGLQVRLQSYFEQKIRENQDREREKYVELLARLKSEVEQSLTSTTDSNRFDAAVRDRVGRMLEAARTEQEKAVASALGEAEVRLKGQQEEAALRLEHLESKLQQRETDLSRIERNLRQEADDLDRRIQVLSERMMPLVRKTWVKIGELEKGGAASEETEAHLNDMRRELIREMRRVEGELLEQTNELRDRLEGTIAHQGRIWLNLLKQLSAEAEDTMKAGPRPARRPAKATESENLADEEFLGADLRATAPYSSFGTDPPNPMDPSAALGPEATTSRRRARQA
jgi:hypothetical protein